MTIKLDGKRVAAEVKANLAERVSTLKEHGIVPGLGTLLVGEDPGSMKYVAGKHADCAEVGIRSIRRDLPADASFDDIAAAVRDLNEDPACTGYIVQLPLPRGVDENAIIGLIDPSKDADGMHPYNLGELVLHVQGDITTPLPCTPRGVESAGRQHLSAKGNRSYVYANRNGKNTTSASGYHKKKNFTTVCQGCTIGGASYSFAFPPSADGGRAIIYGGYYPWLFPASFSK